MNLENRVMREFYPVKCKKTNKLTFSKNHGVRSFGFKKIGPDKKPIFTFSIESPSVEEYGIRMYSLNYNKNGTKMTENIIPETYSGLIGESIMRIIVQELFRRLHKKNPFEKFEFVKTNLNPYEDQRTIRENDYYVLRGISRYNQIVINKNMLRTYSDFATTTEYDGLFEYQQGSTEGLIICESKIGDIGYLRTSENSKEEIYRKIIQPIQSLYPEKQIDFLLMSTRKELAEQKKHKPLQEKVIRLNNYLNKHNIGLIPMTIPETTNSINTIAKSMLHFNRLNSIEEINVPRDNKYIIDKNMLIIMTGKRIDMMLERTTHNSFSIVYDSGNLDNVFNTPFYVSLNCESPFRKKART
ncbi:hypothetical protein KO361_03085 [Candidatus Woesearchaeota archaeon]|nr:hypothetical protein [Candidatus Woesearchaeota archaeon]